MASVPVDGLCGGVVSDARLPTSTSPAARNLTPLRPQLRIETAFLLGRLRRRSILLYSVLPLGLGIVAPPSEARERRVRKAIPPEEYLTSPEGLKYFDLTEGNGPVAEVGATVQVHFDCIYRSITAVSSRESKLLAGNRIIAQVRLLQFSKPSIWVKVLRSPQRRVFRGQNAVTGTEMENPTYQPYEFTVGSPPGKERKREYVDNANGLFSAQAAPKPPPAMYKMTEGMKVGGKRTVIVPADLGYGQKGMNEIPPGATFDLNIELLQVVSPAPK